MNASQSAFYDIGTFMLIFFNSIFMMFSLFIIKDVQLFALSLFLMFLFIILRAYYNRKWENEFAEQNKGEQK